MLIKLVIMAQNVNITSKGIQKVLKNYNEKQAIAEYIWNGFDANADQVAIDYVANELGHLESLTIADNGYGINFEKLQQKFDPFYESEKAIQITTPKHTSKMHGRNGVGRLTFFTFAHTATWFTTYQSDKGFQKGKIQINTGELNNYIHDFSAAASPAGTIGTTVRFTNLRIGLQDLEISIIPFLINEFCWFIELNRNKKYSISINGEPIDFNTNIRTSESFSIKHPDSSISFNIKYVHWKQNLHKELSKYYFTSNGEEIYKDYTTLNKKSDEYYHSVYIDSDFFKDFDFRSVENQHGQVTLFSTAKNSAAYKFLIKELTEYLRSKRKPFLKEYADRLIENYEQEQIFPENYHEPANRKQKTELVALIKALYELEPKLFSALSIDQKKMLVRLLGMLLNTQAQEAIFQMLNDIVVFSPEEQAELTEILSSAR